MVESSGTDEDAYMNRQRLLSKKGKIKNKNKSGISVEFNPNLESNKRSIEELKAKGYFDLSLRPRGKPAIFEKVPSSNNEDDETSSGSE